jgi:hypothetical protein
LAAKVHPGDLFTAVLAVPVTVGHDIVVKSGTVVTGRVESERSLAARPGQVPGSGYFRLTLSSITVEDQQVAVHTSSLFARGTAQPMGIGVQKGHRLTFRLTDLVALDESPTMANTRQSASHANP